jgi:hypothetical protein
MKPEGDDGRIYKGRETSLPESNRNHSFTLKVELQVPPKLLCPYAKLRCITSHETVILIKLCLLVVSNESPCVYFRIEGS